MSQLIQMNQRINAIETIKKITHATRLIAMSSHTRLANKEPIITHFQHEITKLFAQLVHNDTQKQASLFKLREDAVGSLYIIAGSQKGFCGTFNTALLKYVTLQLAKKTANDRFITIGKKASDYIRKQKIEPLENFTNLSSASLSAITDRLTQAVLHHAPHFKEVIIISNKAKTFFVQKPEKTILLPIQSLSSISKNTDLGDYIWPESETELLQKLSYLYLKVNIESLLFSSLVAEQSARFQSMDNATRNAEELLTTMRRDYNKLRQAKITRELLELASSFER